MNHRNNTITSSISKRSINTRFSESRLGYNKRPTPVNILVPSNSNYNSSSRNDDTSNKDTIIQQLLERQSSLEIHLDEQNQLIQQLNYRLETLSNTITVLQQQNMAGVVTTTTNKSTMNLPENVKLLRVNMS